MSRKIKNVIAILLFITMFIEIFGIDKPYALSNPKKTKITQCKSLKEGQLTISWKNVKANKYQIKVATDKNFTKNIKKIKVSGKNMKVTIKGLKKGKTYYVKVRVYKSKRYSKWSSIRIVKIHKHDYKEKVQKAATCITSGKNKKICTCGSVICVNKKKLGHQYKWVAGNNCLECKCMRCNHISKTKEHNFEKTNETELATYYECKNCGKTKEKIKTIQTDDVDRNYTIDIGNGKTKTVTGHFVEEVEEEIIELLNDYRVENNLDELKDGSKKLQGAANIRAVEIAYSFSHIRPNGLRALTSLQSETKCRAENLGRKCYTAQKIMEGWKQSEGHNANMLKEDVNTISVSVFAEKQESGYLYHFVQYFGN